ncbi:MAG: hypothetical protein JNL42_14780 [Anaerolineae bacterium]|nr:hypothetical protein [Anaerolineae bacterium]
MNAKRMILLVVALTAIFALGLTAVSAQDSPGGGIGGGQGNGYQGGRGGGAPGGAMNGNGAYGGGLMLNLPPASTEALSQDSIDLMIDGWLDEQHAYAVYGSIIEQFGAVRPFVNIQRSEAQHIAAWETLFARYGVTVPEVPAFDVPQFASVAEACAAGAVAEVANFDLYDSMLAAFQPYPDLAYVAQALRDASEFSHLPAFENCAG